MTTESGIHDPTKAMPVFSLLLHYVWLSGPSSSATHYWHGPTLNGVNLTKLLITEPLVLPCSLTGGVVWCALTTGKSYIYVQRASVDRRPCACCSLCFVSQEPHLLHKFDEDFYGEKLHLLLCGFIRNELNFKSLSETVDENC